MPASSPLRRLTRFEFDRTLEDLFGDTTKPAAGFPTEEAPYGFDNAAESFGTSPLLAESYFTAAEQIAARAMKKLSTFFSCDTSKTAEATCGTSFVQQVGRRVWRRPLAAAEVGRFDSAYKTLRATNDHTKTLELLLHALMASPHFLYRVETSAVTVSEGVVAPDDWEMASRLSYLLWGTMPDAELFKAAEQGKLATPAGLGQQVDRMLAHPRAQATVHHFFAQWLGVSRLDLVEKDTAVYPAFTSDLLPLLREEQDQFVTEAIWKGDGTIGTLLTAPYTFVNKRLAQFYGLEGGPTGDAFQKVSLNPAQRGGLLTQAGLLSVHAKTNQSSPVARGKFVREALLCTHPPAPPANLNIKPPDLDPKLTTRERFTQHATDPACRPCHQLMDPLGLAFENYDGVGHWRSLEGGRPVDASGELVQTDVDGPFVGALALGRKLGTSAQVSACAVSQWFRFAMGRAETQADTCDLDRLAKAQAAGHGSLRELIAGTVNTDAFRYRRIQNEGDKL
ncbi:MAG: DUF1592 domain-containing protein [Deltaproteobacteria bacterium]|nr:DUF1592 domain-containing protein [Deltaproteobacteria bacterium]